MARAIPRLLFVSDALTLADNHQGSVSITPRPPFTPSFQVALSFAILFLFYDFSLFSPFLPREPVSSRPVPSLKMPLGQPFSF